MAYYTFHLLFLLYLFLYATATPPVPYRNKLITSLTFNSDNSVHSNSLTTEAASLIASLALAVIQAAKSTSAHPNPWKAMMP